jgi:hypothetical protein
MSKPMISDTKEQTMPRKITDVPYIVNECNLYTFSDQ